MIVIVILGISFIVGVLVGMGAMICLGIRREESRHSLLRQPPGPAAAATRSVVGLHVRTSDSSRHANSWVNQANSAGGWRPPAA